MRILAAIIFFNSLFFGAFSQGVVFDSEDLAKVKDKYSTHGVERAITPSRKSLAQYLPYASTYDQGNTSMCVAYSLAVCRTVLYAKNMRIYSKQSISNNGFSPLFIYYNNSTNDSKCTNGLYLYKALTFVEETGFVQLKDVEYPNYYPYKSTRADCEKYPYSNSIDLANAGKYKVDNIWVAENIDDIKFYISNDMPIMSFLNPLPGHFHQSGEEGVVFWDRYKSVQCYGATRKRARCRNRTKNVEGFCYLHLDQTPDIGHCVSVIGYDDDKYGGAVQIFNSAGSSWGVNGLIWVKYTDLIFLCKESPFLGVALEKNYEDVFSGGSTVKIQEIDSALVDQNDFGLFNYLQSFRNDSLYID